MSSSWTTLSGLCWRGVGFGCLNTGWNVDNFSGRVSFSITSFQWLRVEKQRSDIRYLGPRQNPEQGHDVEETGGSSGWKSSLFTQWWGTQHSLGSQGEEHICKYDTEAFFRNHWVKETKQQSTEYNTEEKRFFLVRVKLLDFPNIPFYFPSGVPFS